MRRWNPAVTLVVALALFIPAAASATGMGGYVQFGGGSLDLELDFDTIPTFDDEADSLHVGGGFVLDTNCAMDKLLNYRMNIGLEYVDTNFDTFNDPSMWGVVFDNTLGFGVYRGPDSRLWLGPQVRLGYYWGDGSGAMEDFSTAVVGFGGVVGVNIHFGRLHSLALTVGGRYDLLRGDGDGDQGDFDIDGDAATFFVNLTMLWRGLDDKF